MEARELRIGNLVLFEPFKGSGFEIISVQELPFKKRNVVEPIPLTEDWLVKFGFENLYDTRWQNYSVDLFGDSEGYWLLSEERTNWPKPIKYVHQLQNLYFALTGKELEINQITQ